MDLLGRLAATASLFLQTGAITLAAQLQPNSYATFLPLTTHARPALGQNISCVLVAIGRICASVSHAAPTKGSAVTAYGWLIQDNVAQSDVAMSTTWRYKTTKSYCAGISAPDGIASCTRDIGTATSGYKVEIDVWMGGYTAMTHFVPQ
jgi:hypothetical protein